MCKGHNIHSDIRISHSKSEFMNKNHETRIRGYATQENARFKNGDMQ
jgi:hypothetical protein